MAKENDWRLGGQERFLRGVTLVRRPYRRNLTNPDWDHDHCAFCWAKFMVDDQPGTLHEGYSTEDEYHWICLNCFEDFKVSFEWRVRDAGA
jgi:hypothetical protein